MSIGTLLAVGIVTLVVFKFIRERYPAKRGKLTEADLLLSEIEKKDREDPGWDKDARKASCKAALLRGRSPHVLRMAYADVFDESVREIEAEKTKGVMRHWLYRLGSALPGRFC